jgi:hypothetical protein
MSELPEPILKDDTYPFIDQRYPLADLVMIEMPEDLQRILTQQAERNGEGILRDAPVEVRCVSDQFGDASFLVYWPHGHSMHTLAPRQFRKGNV